jgi:hypothetical protein
MSHCAENECVRIIGDKVTSAIVRLNDSHEAWDKKLIKIRKLFNQAGYRVVVKR